MTDDTLPTFGLPPIVIGSICAISAFLLATVALGVVVSGQKRERIRLSDAPTARAARPPWLYRSPTGRGLMERK